MPGWRLSALLAVTVAATVAPVAVALTVAERVLWFRAGPHTDEVVLISGVSRSDPFQTVARLADMPHFRAVASFDLGHVNYRSSRGAGRLRAIETTAAFFDALAVRPVQGRFFRADDELAAEGVVVLSERLWRRWSRAPDLQQVVLNSIPHVIVGVAPAWCDVLGGADLFMVRRRAIPGRLVEDWQTVSLDGMVGRLTAASAIHDAEAVLAAQDGNKRTGQPVSVRSVSSVVRQRTGSVLVAALFALGALLALGLFNAVALLVQWFETRVANVGIRLSLGAEPHRVMIEDAPAFAAAVAGGTAAGLLLAFWSTQLIHSASGSFGHLFLNLRLSWRAAAGAAALAAMAMSVAALWYGRRVRALSRSNLAGLMAGRGRDARGRLTAIQTVVVLIPIALTTGLLGPAAISARTFVRASGGAVNFDPDDLVVIEVMQPSVKRAPFPGGGVPPMSWRIEAAAAFTREVARRDRDLRRALAALPGVQAVGSTTRLPLSEIGSSIQWVDGGDRRKGLSAEVVQVSGDYFDAIGTPLVLGRSIDSSDVVAERSEVVVNTRLARALWGDTNPLGRLLHIDHGGPREIVGVTESVAFLGLGSDIPSQVYVPNVEPVHRAADTLSYLIRTRRPLAAATLQSAVEAAGAGTRLISIKPGGTLITEAFRQDRDVMMVLGLLTLLTGTLGVLGVGVTVSQWVLQHRAQLQIRMMLGATFSRLMAAALIQTLTVALSGVLIGTFVGYVFTHAFSSFVTPMPFDIETQLMAVVIVGLASLAAGLTVAFRLLRPLLSHANTGLADY